MKIVDVSSFIKNSKFRPEFRRWPKKSGISILVPLVLAVLKI